MSGHLEEVIAAAVAALAADPQLRFLTDGERQQAAAVAVTAAEEHLRRNLHLIMEWRVSYLKTVGDHTHRETWSTTLSQDTAWADHAQAVNEGTWADPWVEHHYVGDTPWVREHRPPAGGETRR